MIKKTTIAYFIFTIALCYIIWPWFFEKNLLFNELLSAIGLFFLFYKRFKIGNDTISICMIFLILWSGVHVITSIFRMDSVYFYLRNLVIVYSMLAFFIGFYCLQYLEGFIQKVRTFLRSYIGIFLLIPLPRILFERFGMAVLFPALFKNAGYKWLPYLLIVINIIYAISYPSVTILILAAFYFLLFISPGYKFFKQVIISIALTFTILFIYLQPNLNIIGQHYHPYSYQAIREVMGSHPLLSIDGNSTWRLVLWEQILVDNFPGNLFGLGLGTPVLKYYPVEDYTKLSTLPYVLGAHNSFVYLFGRLGIIFVLLMIVIYTCIFREYFYNKAYYYSHNQILIFWSFVAATIIALFNPALESPIYAAGYWLLLGFLARCIYNRKQIAEKMTTV